MVELLGGGSVINGATLSSLTRLEMFLRDKNCRQEVPGAFEEVLFCAGLGDHMTSNCIIRGGIKT